jgi:hypothetical protein
MSYGVSPCRERPRTSVTEFKGRVAGSGHTGTPEAPYAATTVH